MDGKRVQVLAKTIDAATAPAEGTPWVGQQVRIMGTVTHVGVDGTALVTPGRADFSSEGR